MVGRSAGRLHGAATERRLLSPSARIAPAHLIPSRPFLPRPHGVRMPSSAIPSTPCLSHHARRQLPCRRRPAGGRAPPARALYPPPPHSVPRSPPTLRTPPSAPTPHS